MNKIFTFLLLSTFAFNVYADEKLDKVLQEIQALNKDLKTLEKAVYSKSFSVQSTGSSEGIPASLEGALTRQLVKLSELEEQIQKLQQATKKHYLICKKYLNDWRRCKKIQS